MTKRTLLSLALLCTFSVPKFFAQTAGTKLNYEYALNDPLNARIYTLKNGLKVYLSVYKNAPRIQTYIAIKAGSKNDPSYATGLAHYLEHMVFKGTDVYGTKDYKKESIELKKIEDLYEIYRKQKDETLRAKTYHLIDSISGVAAKYAIANEYDKMLATIGADGTNAFTSLDQTVYVNDIPSNQVDNWLKIEAERFRKPVLRLFHTELEAVYEEKNRGLDNDDDKIWESLFAGLFKKHTYGTQTTIGTIEHLKNPSMVEITKYYNKYYVPNNMAIIMSGDFDPDKVIASIEKHFGSFVAKPVEPYTFDAEEPIKEKVVYNILGPNPASVNMAWRLSGAGSKDADICQLLTGMLSNGTAGLIDINLNQAQKVLQAYDYFYQAKDYSVFYLGGEPKSGQSLQDVEKLLLSQLDLVKKGDFPTWLMDAVVTDLKLKRTKELENNRSRVYAMMEAFVNDIKWQSYVNSLDRISKISRQELMFFANKTFTDRNYVVAYKETGEDKNVIKVEKPAITPVEVDRDNASPFVKEIANSKPANVEPKFLDYQNDLVQTTVKSGIPLLYTRNNENNLFELYYHFDMGSNHNKLLPVAIKYIPFLSTPDLTAPQIKQELYKLGCTFNVFSDEEKVRVSLSGLNENFPAALKLFEKVLANPVVDETVLKNMIGDLMKERQDAKLQKRLILSKAMVNYARYGASNPFSNTPSDDELSKLNASQVKYLIASLLKYEHKVLYYGPKEIEPLKTLLNSEHIVPEQLSVLPASQKFEEKILDNSVYVVDYDMKQAEIIMLSNGGSYSKDLVPLVSLYNNYFGGGMSGVVFQDLRESKALAYSTYSRYNLPNKLFKKSFNISYIGSQADKLPEALKGLSDLLDKMPKSEGAFNSAKEMLLQEMSTQRITKAEVLFNYLDATALGNTSDIRKNIYEKCQNYTYNDILNFQQEFIQGKRKTILVLGKKELLDLKTLEAYGPVKYLTLQEIFGY